ncbi:gamma-butyrobetaine hydroxylase-like domain-containing protein [Kaistia sp. 32K]|uniref:gamma-butyrobetaine hydroxylase-like domain-containing protein n=1 Tax=Kaistia sp. 32K TaxID=2795690 RepID=UPI00191532FC|nr:DUF971 domain-containing protein [Kaistia sp. 32K]
MTTPAAPDSATAAPWPTEIRLSPDKRLLTVTFEDGARYALPAEYLRVTSPSAEVQGHSKAQKQTVPGKRDVAIQAISPVGNYAVRLVFDDGHDTGLFTWTYLAELGRDQERLWAAYLSELQEKGLSRDRR